MVAFLNNTIKLLWTETAEVMVDIIQVEVDQHGTLMVHPDIYIINTARDETGWWTKGTQNTFIAGGQVNSESWNGSAWTC